MPHRIVLAAVALTFCVAGCGPSHTRQADTVRVREGVRQYRRGENERALSERADDARAYLRALGGGAVAYPADTAEARYIIVSDSLARRLRFALYVTDGQGGTLEGEIENRAGVDFSVVRVEVVGAAQDTSAHTFLDVEAGMRNRVSTPARMAAGRVVRVRVLAAHPSPYPPPRSAL